MEKLLTFNQKNVNQLASNVVETLRTINNDEFEEVLDQVQESLLLRSHVKINQSPQADINIKHQIISKSQDAGKRLHIRGQEIP
jgi:hypothetical protein